MKFSVLRKKNSVVSILYDAWNAPHPEGCTCYKCSGDPESSGFMLVNKGCKGCKNTDRHYCEKVCPIKLKAIQEYQNQKGTQKDCYECQKVK